MGLVGLIQGLDGGTEGSLIEMEKGMEWRSDEDGERERVVFGEGMKNDVNRLDRSICCEYSLLAFISLSCKEK